MAKKRESIDDLIDAHVWMRCRESRLNRPLALDDVSDELLARFEAAAALSGERA
jgi:hypothetical protein